VTEWITLLENQEESFSEYLGSGNVSTNSH